MNSPRIQQGIDKFIARKCPSKNVLDEANVGALGICYKCGEHFRCAVNRDIEMYDEHIPKDVHTVTTIAEVNPVYKCNLFDYAGDSKNKLAKHMGDINCGQCGEKFWLRTELDRHMKTIHSSKCCECEKLFDNEMDLQVHIQEKHMVRKPQDALPIVKCRELSSFLFHSGLWK